jgi:uncharacterized Zn finger protein
VEQETKNCPSCSTPSRLEEVGTASGRKHFHCPKCGPWREKNPFAAALGKLGGQAAQAKLSTDERSKRATELAEKRWRDEKLKKNVPA